ncbi:DNA-processing protein DprA [Candidatus Peregrinibacteria bacterium]|nr:MAG: DNA-processing protein DprA [Candidatus Peregrinibacteria bacterium]
MNQPYEYRWAQWGLFHNGSGASPVDYYRWMLSTHGDLEKAWHQIRQTDLEKLGFRADKIARLMHIKAEMDHAPLPQAIHDLQLNLYSIDDPEYPEPLKTISNPPVFLWVKGKLPLFHKAIGIVGSRLITESGRILTEQITTHLVQRGWVIISGLAMGVDACAHQTTLKHKGVTLAVLGCGSTAFIRPKIAA